MVSSAVVIVPVRAERVVASASTLSSARLISVLCWSSPPMKVSSRLERVPDLALPALQRLPQLGVDGLQLGEPAAVEHQRQRAEELLDLHVAIGAVEGDQRAVGELAGGGLGARRGELDVLLAQQ